mmetsp:Transcript_9214/g.19673  ORF Transcript_9214/g.19673 Transcript_9214/m.19673 type:complete len:84 (-) Transcript_9214:2067-2318(-)
MQFTVASKVVGTRFSHNNSFTWHKVDARALSVHSNCLHSSLHDNDATTHPNSTIAILPAKEWMHPPPLENTTPPHHFEATVNP